MASVTRGGIAPSRLAALASSLHALGQASLREIEIAGQAGVFIESLGGKILIEAIPHAGSDAVLCVVSKAETLAGKLLWACKQCAGQVAGELAS